MMDRERRWTEMFDLFDTNGDGHLSEEDILVSFRRLVGSRGISEDSPEGKAILGRLRDNFAKNVLTADLDHDGKVTRDEWKKFHEAQLNRGGGYLPSARFIANVHAVFKAFDLDGDGRIGTDDYVKSVAIASHRRFEEPALREHWRSVCERWGSAGALDANEFLAADIEIMCSSAPTPFWVPAA